MFERACIVNSLPEGYTVKELRLLQGDAEFEHSKQTTEKMKKDEIEAERKKLTPSPSGNERD